MAHHPTCWHYRHHTIRIRNVSICLGCVGFYSGMITGILLTYLLGLNRFNWEVLVTIATMLFIPTMLRLLNLRPFNSEQRELRFTLRWLLGVGVAVGIYSILNAPNLVVGFIQLVLGIGLYSIISYRRITSGNFWYECQNCSFHPSPDCPGFSPFYLPKKSAKKEEIKQSEN